MGKARAKGKRKSTEAASASKRAKSTRHEDERKRQNLVKKSGRLSSESDWQQQIRRVAVSELNLGDTLPDEDVLGDDEYAALVEEVGAAFQSQPSCSKEAEGGHRETGNEQNQNKEIPDRGEAKKKKKKQRPAKDDSPFVSSDACLVDIAAGGKLLEKLVKAEKKTRKKAAKETRGIAGWETFHDVQQDAWISTYDFETKTWSYDASLPEHQPGRFILNRLQLLFSPLSSNGRGENEEDAVSLTLDRLERFIFGPVAQCVDRYLGSRNVERKSISFMIANAMPTMRCMMGAPSTQSVSDVHLAFKPELENSLGALPYKTVHSIVNRHVGAVARLCADISFSLDVHSDKTRKLLYEKRKTAILNVNGTFGKQPSCYTFENCHSSPMLAQLSATQNSVFNFSCPSHSFHELVDLDWHTNTLTERRSVYTASLVHALAQVPEQTLFKFQRVAVQLILQMFATGKPGALISLDVGLGKTIVMFTTTYLLLAAGNVQSVVWVLQKFQMRNDSNEEVTVILASFKAFLLGLGFLSEPQIRQYIDCVRVTLAGQQTTHETSLKSDLDAALRTGDVAVFVDEASLYLGSLRHPSKMHSVLTQREYHGNLFVVAMTATPLHSYAERLFNLVQFIGGKLRSTEDTVLWTCVSQLAHEFFENNCDASVMESVVTSLSRVVINLDRVHATDESTKQEVQTLIANMGIDRRLVFVRLDDSYLSNALDSVFHGLSQTGKQHASDLLALHPEAFRALYGARMDFDDSSSNDSDDSDDSENVVEPSEQRGGVSSLTEALVEVLAETLNATESSQTCLVFFSSDTLAALVYTFQEMCQLGYADVMGICDGATPDDERRKLFDAVNSGGPIRLLFMTDRVGGFGLDARNVSTAIYVGSPWSDANIVQALGRVLRVCATDRQHEKTRVITILPISTSNGSIWKRFARCNARAIFFGSVFPSVVHGDRQSLDVRNAGVLLRSSPFTHSGRERYAREFGAPFVDSVLKHSQLLDVPYNDGIEAINEMLLTCQKKLPSVDFLCVEGSSASKKSSSKEKTGKQPRSNEEDKLHTLNDRERRRAVTEAFAKSAHAKLSRALVDRLDGEKAQAVAESLERAATILASEGPGVFTLAALQDNEYFIPFDTQSPLQREMRDDMIFASAWSQMSRHYNSGSAFPQPKDTNEFMAYGNNKEAEAISHVCAKYGFTPLPHVKKFTKVSQNYPTVLAASADAITSDGTILEMKCVKNRATFLERVSFDARRQIDGYYDQVQAQLEVYDLNVGLLCICHVGEDGEWLSVEYPILRDAQWLQNNLEAMRKQIRMHQNKRR